jgi:hypothetical protein
MDQRNVPATIAGTPEVLSETFLLVRCRDCPVVVLLHAHAPDVCAGRTRPAAEDAILLNRNRRQTHDRL